MGFPVQTIFGKEKIFAASSLQTRKLFVVSCVVTDGHDVITGGNDVVVAISCELNE